MTDMRALIAKQALRIEKLERRLANIKRDCREIRSQCYGIGGPLNDNKKGYTERQKMDFRRIAVLASWGAPEDDDD